MTGSSPLISASGSRAERESYFFAFVNTSSFVAVTPSLSAVTVYPSASSATIVSFVGPAKVAPEPHFTHCEAPPDSIEPLVGK